MEFPQYLWRVGLDAKPWVLRRGNDCNEPLTKCIRKDYPPGIVGVLDHCEIGDAKHYTRSHMWNWLNS